MISTHPSVSIISNLPGVGNLAGSVIGAVGGIFTAVLGRDSDRPRVVVDEYGSRAQRQMEDANKKRDVTLYIDGRRATSEEEQRILGYQLGRISRLQGESTTGV